MADATGGANMDYDEMRRTFRWDIPEYYNFAVDTVGTWARDPDKVAMRYRDQFEQEHTITYAAFDRRSSRLAAALSARGIRRGDPVLVVLPRIPAWWETILALMKLGAIAVPGTTQLTERDLRYRIQRSEATAIVTDPEVAPRVDAAAEFCPTLALLVSAGAEREGWVAYETMVAEGPETFTPARTRSDNPCLLYFTSGTTAHPKMVLHTHASYPLGHLVTGKYWLALSADDLHWNVSDNGWAKAAWSSLFGPWLVGAAIFNHDARGRFDPAGVLRILEETPITSLCCAPTIYRMLIVEDLSGFEPRALRSCVAAGEPLNPEVISSWRTATGLTIRDGYGQTETVVLCANFPGLEIRPGSMGKPAPGFDLSIVDDGGRELEAGEEGHIAVRIRPEPPVGFFHGYWKEEALTEQAFAGDWYLTGDRAIKDGDGYFWFIGRADDVIISSGYRISPFEIESALLEHPAVAESAVVGSPDPIRGSIVKAFVVMTPGYQASGELAEELTAFVTGLTEPYAHPREIEFVADLPKTVSGKIRRVELRVREANRKRSANR